MDSSEIKLRRVKLTLNTALAYFNLQASFRDEPPMSINELARRCEVSPTTVHRLFRDPETDPKAANALSLDLASRLVSVLGCGIDELLTIEDTEETLDSISKD